MRRNSESGVTVKDVARELGVSPSTVSNAYNRPDQLSEALRERVMETARRLGYAGPNPLGRSLKRQRSDAVGILFGNRLAFAFADPAVVQFLEGVSEAIAEAGLGLVLLPGVSGESGNPTMVRGAAIDGVVIHSMASDDPLVGAVLERNIPVVAVDQMPVEGVASVSVDDVGAGRMAVEHLLHLGHRRIAVISSRLALDARSGLADVERQGEATIRSSRARLEGCAAAVEVAGLPWEDVSVYESPETTLDEGKVAAINLLSEGERPTAIVAFGDQLAFGAMEAAEDMGFGVPDDLSVIGFDDIPGAALTTPSLTTLKQPHAEKGLLAGRELVAQLRADDRQEPEEILLPTRLVIRDSTARAK